MSCCANYAKLKLVNPNRYFRSRSQIGSVIAGEVAGYGLKNIVVLALSPGGVVIGNEIATLIKSEMALLLLNHVYLPGDISLGVINEKGIFTYDQSISAADISEFESEYRGVIEQNKSNALHKLHADSGEAIVEPSFFNDKNVFIVSDFAKTGTSFKAAEDFLKPARTQSLNLVTVVAQVEAVDVMHQIADRLIIVHTTDKDFPKEHYFEDNSLPNGDEIRQILKSLREHNSRENAQ